ncbi:MAG: S-layer homology domain-containing protein, partial [Clostridiales bacterium]
HQHHITFNLHVRGEAKRIELEIPIAALANLGRDDQINMSIKSTIGEISLDAAAINGLAEQMGNTVVIALGRNQDGTIVVEIKVGDKVIDAITGEIRVVFSARGLNTGSVPVLIGIDGKETLSRKSYVDGQKMVVLMNGSGILKIRDNALKFNDIQPNYWGKGAVDFVTARRLFLGSSTNEFNTKGGMTRGMLATVFYRLENTPAVTSGHKVPAGIKPGAYYAQAAVWANANQIINGTDKGFEPELAVSNEQL